MEYISDDPDSLLQAWHMTDAQRRVVRYMRRIAHFRQEDESSTRFSKPQMLFLENATEHHVDARLFHTEIAAGCDDFASEIAFSIRGYIRGRTEKMAIGKPDKRSIMTHMEVRLNEYENITILDQMPQEEQEAIIHYAYAIQKQEWDKRCADGYRTSASQLVDLQKRLQKLELHFRREMSRLVFEPYLT